MELVNLRETFGLNDNNNLDVTEVFIISVKEQNGGKEYKGSIAIKDLILEVVEIGLIINFSKDELELPHTEADVDITFHGSIFNVEDKKVVSDVYIQFNNSLVIGDNKVLITRHFDNNKLFKVYRD